jgi:hypothetical protein
MRQTSFLSTLMRPPRSRSGLVCVRAAVS